jgi:hypothetical protein
MTRPNQPKIVLWRSMYDPAGIDILRERDAEVVLVDREIPKAARDLV